MLAINEACPYHTGVNILAIDTSTEACSAALLRHDGEIFSTFDIAPRQHTLLLPAMMDRVLADSGLPKAKLTHCAFANGPGAFTGIRIAAAQAQGIGLALGIPLVQISTLALLAQISLDRQGCNRVMVALDARMQEIYWAVYERDQQGCAQLVGKEHLSAIAEIEITSGIEYGAGHGWLEELRDQAEFPVDPDLLPDARGMLDLARAAIADKRMQNAASVSINYLRNRVAEKARN